eukprot:COSAG02_NODE_1056_length_14925_cov_84.064212_15_plen_71_part_01
MVKESTYRKESSTTSEIVGQLQEGKLVTAVEVVPTDTDTNQWRVKFVSEDGEVGWLNDKTKKGKPNLELAD